MKITPKKYSEFIHNEEQRPIIQRHVNALIESMKMYGFLPSKPIQCYKRKDGKLVVVDGHHRLSAAMRLNLDIHVVIEDESAQLTMAPVNIIVKKWNMDDFIRLYASRGNKNYIKLMEYKDKGIPSGMAASMLINNAAASGNACKTLADGSFKIKTFSLIDSVVNLILEFGGLSSILQNRSFIAAISKCIMCDQFDLDVFKTRLRENPTMMKKTSNEDQMLSVIEQIYNHRSRNPQPIKFHVEAASRDRNAKGRIK